MTGKHSKLEKSLNYFFQNKTLLELALTHRSIGSDNNERLEYLGDAVLGFIIADQLFHRYPDSTEGKLTRLRASLVKKETLASLARELDLGDFVRLGTGELKSGGWRRDSILANTFEAIIGAIYLDSDFQTCQSCLLEIYKELFDSASADTHSKDPKTRLQEYLQARKVSLPIYKTIKEEGEAHSRKFTVECQSELLDETIIATGRSKRIAEQSAAEQALKILEAQ